MKKYPKVRRPGHSSVEGLFENDDHTLLITEKFDGNNFRFKRDDDGIRYGSRNEDLGVDPETESVPPSPQYTFVENVFNTLRISPPSFVMNRLYGGYYPNTPKMFRDVIDYIDYRITPDDLRNVENEIEKRTDHDEASIVLYGENAVQHTIHEYDWEDVPQFQLFDVWAEYGNGESEWLSWGVVEWIANELGLETVPVIERTTVGEFDVEEFEVPESVYRADDGPAEGVIFRNLNTSVRAKYISEEFAERHSTAKSKSMVDPGDEIRVRVHESQDKLLEDHVTERRIEKNVQKIIEDPSTEFDSPAMEMMPILHEMVWKDVWAEDYEEIIFENWVLDLDEAHNRAASKTAEHLQNMIQNNKQPVAAVNPETGHTIGEEVEG